MKYQTEEENQQFVNRSQNRFSENPNQSNSFLQQNNKKKEEWIYVNPSIYIMYCLLNGFSIILGCIFKLIHPINRETIGKKSILTGIPIIRNYYFVFPTLLNLIYFVWCIYAYYSNASLRAENQQSCFKFLKNIRSAFFFTNILYYCVVLPLYKNYGFKLSGHVIASILSGGMIVNLHNTYLPFMSIIKQNFNQYIFYANMFLYYHSIYTIFWSAWIFHRVPELILAYIIAIFALIFVHVLNIDELILNMVDFKSFRRNPKLLYRN